ncbi:MAG: KTSC domain-containing protein [Epsilonproteobacteria bacterium]|nr:MAG: KTSC domain-containing protein [Campylobacterota bacterium]RLA66550.1 MAG: KTSC domain-containing protein [Campylobacterota bacterium]
MIIFEGCDSSNVSSIGYCKYTSVLSVIFSNGGTYLYFGVSDAIFDELKISESKGKYLNGIKKYYRFTKLVMPGTQEEQHAQ